MKPTLSGNPWLNIWREGLHPALSKPVFTVPRKLLKQPQFTPHEIDTSSESTSSFRISNFWSGDFTLQLTEKKDPDSNPVSGSTSTAENLQEYFSNLIGSENLKYFKLREQASKIVIIYGKNTPAEVVAELQKIMASGHQGYSVLATPESTIELPKKKFSTTPPE